jgi:hypothetical protein
MTPRSNSARGEDVEDQLAAGGGGVEHLGERAEAEAAAAQVISCVSERARRSSFGFLY